MLAEFGLFTLILSLILSALQFLIPITLLANKKNDLSLIVAISLLQFIFITCSFLILIFSFISNDFSIKYVVSHSHINLPFIYKVGASWGGHEGSILLWILILNLWTIITILSKHKVPQQFYLLFISSQGAIATGFTSFSLFTSNPFERNLPLAPPNGLDLNPLLQDIGLIFHPPLLYMGYIGFTVAFSFAIAALLYKKLSKELIQWIQPLIISSWVFLTLGICLGSQWAYRELGWGGWWFWDPVENASLMPWLIGIALIHSLRTGQKRGDFKLWTVNLCIINFFFSLIGIFLIRSGILNSIHSFTTDANRGLYLLFILLLFISISLILLLKNHKYFISNSSYKIFSRENYLLINNLLLLASCIIIFIGTIYPLVLESLGYAQISVGTQWFNINLIPISIFSAFLIATSFFSHWGASNKTISKFSIISFISLILIFIILIVSNIQLDTEKIVLTIILWSASLIILSSLLSLSSHYRKKNTLSMTLSHTGLAILMIGASCSGLLESTLTKAVSVGETLIINNNKVTLSNITTTRTQNYITKKLKFSVNENYYINSEKRYYPERDTTTTEAGIHSNYYRDIYIVAGEEISSHKWSVKIHHKPFLKLIWIGCYFIIAGGLLLIIGRIKNE